MRPSPLTLTLLVAFATGCGAATNCRVGRPCGDARWLDEGAVVDGPRVIAAAVASASPGVSLAESRGDAMRVSSRPVFVRFDLSSLAGVAGVERAVLSLTPHTSWQTDERTARLVVRGVASAWTVDDVASGASPALRDEVAFATLASGVRAPLRVDVTAIVRTWTVSNPSEGLALELEGPEAVFAGAGASLWARPRLEVVVR
jgi:hypothetical protein